MSHRPEFEAALEAILFVTSEPVGEERLIASFDEGEREEVRAALGALRERYRPASGRGVFLEEVAGGLRIVTAPEQHPYLRRFFDASGGQKLSMAALETLAIVAYRQPVTAPEIQELRSKSPSGVLKGLLERRLIRIAGRKEVVGRPFLYATTREFLMHFGLRSLGELPPLEEFEEALGIGDEPAIELAVTERVERPAEEEAARDAEAAELDESAPDEIAEDLPEEVDRAVSAASGEDEAPEDFESDLSVVEAFADGEGEEEPE
ncbi:MAG: SMC-Scp complex subunit ScpB [Acidobacteria bacterium]|nr:SMC-Scp complex subunit ScpB [Acidobacteriota bacterium]MCB9378794.1 SMC-Scp complex subunit ScpB [Holophagales bacterium]